MSLLRVEDLRTYYHTPLGPVRAVDGVNFQLQPNERYGLIGESGSGKSTIALSLLRLIRAPGRIEAGHIWLDGVDLMGLPDEEMRQVRLAQIALVTQGAMNSLNPVIRVRNQIADGFDNHGIHLSKADLEERTKELLERVGLEQAVANMFPHELSGGMKQRVCIAIAISLRPKIIIADEPTSALDVVVQRRIMQTLRKVQEELGAAVILIGHDMGLMAQFADRLGVLYAGKLAEEGTVKKVFAQPELLMNSLPSLDQKEVLQDVPGAPPSLLNPPSGCVFHPRCPYVMDRCKTEVADFKMLSAEHRAACHLLDEHQEVGQ
jgi:oligopeptide/dipeptide ABC transporter ATP-binding protein